MKPPPGADAGPATTPSAPPGVRMLPDPNQVPGGMTGGRGGLRIPIDWPTADVAKLREAATIWRNLAETIRDNYASANSNARSLTSNNAGAAIDAFEKYWQQFGDAKNGALPAGANACDAMSTYCSRYADKVHSTRTDLEHTAWEALAEVAATTVAAFFTWGATEVVADGVIANALRVAAGIFASFASQVAGTALGVDLLAVSFFLSSALPAAIIVGTATAVSGTFSGDTAGNAMKELLGDKPMTNAELRHDLLVAGLEGGAAGGLLGGLGDMTAENLSRLLSNAADAQMTDNPQLYYSLMTASRTLEGVTGKVAPSVLASVASQLLTAQQFDAKGVAADQLTEALERAAEGNN